MPAVFATAGSHARQASKALLLAVRCEAEGTVEQFSRRPRFHCVHSAAGDWTGQWPVVWNVVGGSGDFQWVTGGVVTHNGNRADLVLFYV